MSKLLIFGTASLFFAQMIALLSGYGINIYIARTLGPDDYGIYAVIISIISLLTLLTVVGTQGATSKYVAENPRQSSAVRQSGLRLNGLIAVLVGTLYFIMASPIAGVLNDRSLLPYLRLSALIIPPYFLYPVFIGYFNGLKKYNRQSLIAIIYSIGKLFAIIALVILGLRIYGAISGFALGAYSSIAVGFILVKKSPAALNKFSMLKLLKFAVPLTIFTFSFEGTKTISLLYVKSMLGQNDLTAYYNVGNQISRISHLFSISLGTALFPLVAGSFARGDIAGLTRNIKIVFLYLSIFIIPLTAGILIFSNPIVSLLFGEKYLPAAAPLKILGIAEVFVGIAYILYIILTAIEKQKTAMVCSVIVFGVAVGLNKLFIPLYSISGAAYATLTAFIIGAAIAGLAIYRYFHLNIVKCCGWRI